MRHATLLSPDQRNGRSGAGEIDVPSPRKAGQSVPVPAAARTFAPAHAASAIAARTADQRIVEVAIPRRPPTAGATSTRRCALSARIPDRRRNQAASPDGGGWSQDTDLTERP